MTTDRSRRRFFGTAAAAAAWPLLGRVPAPNRPLRPAGRLAAASKLGVASYSMREFPLDQALGDGEDAWA